MEAATRRDFWTFAQAYAWRSLGRNRRRSLLTIATVAFSVLIGIVADRYSDGLLGLWSAGAIDTGIGDLQLHHRGFHEQEEGLVESVTLQGNLPEIQALAADPDVSAIVPRLHFEGVVAAKGRSVYFVGLGTNPKEEEAVAPRLFSTSDLGRFLDPSKPEGVVLGKGLAAALGVGLGEMVTLTASTIKGAVNALDFSVIGIVDVPIPSFSQRIVYVDLRRAGDLTGAGSRINELAIRLRDGRHSQRFLDEWRTRLASSDLLLEPWWEIEPLIRRIERLWHSVVSLIIFLLYISAAVAVLNIIFMVVAERTVEIGTLLALGAHTVDVKRLFALEGATIGAVGGVIGAVLGNAIVLGMGTVGVPFKNPFGSDQVLVYPTMSAAVTGVGLVAAIAICWLAALIPCRRVAKVDPVTAFRGQLN